MKLSTRLDIKVCKFYPKRIERGFEVYKPYFVLVGSDFTEEDNRMGNQTVRQAMQQAAAQQQASTQQSAAQRGVAYRQAQQETASEKLHGAVQQRTKSAQEEAKRETEQQRKKRQEAQRARQRAQQRAQQKNAAKRRRNNIIKILLAAILVMQVICSVQLFMVLQTANKLMDTFEKGNVLGNGAQSVNSAGVFENAGDKGSVAGSGDFVAGGANKDAAAQDVLERNDKGKESGISEEDAWKLVLVNKWNEMEEGYVPELTEYAEGHLVDARIEDALRDMIGGAKKAGYAIYLLSAYRDVDKQTDLYEAEVAKWRAAGYTQKAAEEQAGTIVAVPGTSEHHLGLAVDLVSSEHVKLDEGAEKTKGYKWLAAHCHEYGFILRYPNGTTEITGIIYEPWHFRYVGVEAAAEIMEAGITLEEYLEQLKTNT